MEFRRAIAQDIDALVELRMAMRAEREETPCSIDPGEFMARTRDYFIAHIPHEDFISWLAVEDREIVATSGMCMYRVPPTYGNPNGRVAYLVNMYTVPGHRGKGIATKLLDLLVEDARAQGCGRVTLNASKAGRPIYEEYGFTEVVGEMEYFLD